MDTPSPFVTVPFPAKPAEAATTPSAHPQSPEMAAVRADYLASMEGSAPLIPTEQAAHGVDLMIFDATFRQSRPVEQMTLAERAAEAAQIEAYLKSLAQKREVEEIARDVQYDLALKAWQSPKISAEDLNKNPILNDLAVTALLKSGYLEATSVIDGTTPATPALPKKAAATLMDAALYEQLRTDKIDSPTLLADTSANKASVQAAMAPLVIPAALYDSARAQAKTTAKTEVEAEKNDTPAQPGLMARLKAGASRLALRVGAALTDLRTEMREQVKDFAYLAQTVRGFFAPKVSPELSDEALAASVAAPAARSEALASLTAQTTPTLATETPLLAPKAERDAALGALLHPLDVRTTPLKISAAKVVLVAATATLALALAQGYDVMKEQDTANLQKLAATTQAKAATFDDTVTQAALDRAEATETVPAGQKIEVATKQAKATTFDDTGRQAALDPARTAGTVPAGQKIEVLTTFEGRFGNHYADVAHYQITASYGECLSSAAATAVMHGTALRASCTNYDTLRGHLSANGVKGDELITLLGRVRDVQTGHSTLPGETAAQFNAVTARLDSSLRASTDSYYCHPQNDPATAHSMANDLAAFGDTASVTFSRTNMARRICQMTGIYDGATGRMKPQLHDAIGSKTIATSSIWSAKIFAPVKLAGNKPS